LAQSYNRGGVQISRELTLMNKIVDASMKAMQGQINRSIPLTLGSLRALAGSMPRQFNGLPSQMNFIGLSAMNGLTAGLIRGSSGAINQARYVANQIKSTMQSALKIKSPSRVMRDEVGRWIPEGIAMGIKGNVNAVNDAINWMSDKLVSYSAPELALGSVGLLGTDSVLGSVKNETVNNTYEKATYTVEIVTTLDGRVIAREIVDDISELQNKSKYGRNKARRRGSY